MRSRRYPRTRKPVPRPDLERQVLPLIRPGRSDQQIADMLGVDCRYVSQVRRALGIPRQCRNGVPKGTNSNPNRKGANPPSECWSCGIPADRCGFHTTLEAQGWYVAPFLPGMGKETICPLCVHEYGVPPPMKYVPPESTQPAADSVCSEGTERAPRVYRVHSHSSSRRR